MPQNYTDNSKMSEESLTFTDLCDSNLWVQQKSNEEKVYYYNPKTRNTRWEKPTGSVRVITQAEFETYALKILHERQEKIHLEVPSPQLVVINQPVRLPVPLTEEQMQMELDGIEKAIVDCQKIASDWSMFTNPNGRDYYYNTKTLCSQWNEPNEIVLLAQLKRRTDELRRLLNILHTGKAFIGEASPNDHNKPYANIPIKGSPWCLVWLTSGKCFFFNPTTKKSIWKVPPELVGRPEINEMFANPPEAVEKLKRRADNVESEEVDKKPRTTAGEDLRFNVNDESRSLFTLTDKSKLSHSERIQHFKRMLLENQVSVYSTLENEKDKIKNDPRYLLLNTKERKSVFDAFVRERAEDERKEKIEDLKRKRLRFKELLAEIRLKPGFQFADLCASRHCRDNRFKEVEKMRDREQIFNEYMADRSQEILKETQEVRKCFVEYLNESLGDISPWNLKALNWTSAKDCLNTNDTRYVNAGSLRSQWFAEYVRTSVDTSSDSNGAKALVSDNLQDRIRTSLRKREEQVRMEMNLSLREREEERSHHMKIEAIADVKALLNDTVKDDHAKWRKMKEALKKDGRYNQQILPKKYLKSLFKEHISEIKQRKKMTFRRFLDELQVTLTSEWDEVYTELRDDSRYTKLGLSSSKCEEEFNIYKKDLRTRSIKDFNELLLETKLIDHTTLSCVKRDERYLKGVESCLLKDKRYLMFDHVPVERKRMLFEFMHQLEERGPPPPPTATDPNKWKKQ
ncbi:hypothetical protein ACOME3_007253 [Neoechinorhynchus agilis]